MISSIEINQFRGIREGKLENLTPLTILVGPNGCGKSSVLDAMLIGASPTPAGLLEVVQRHKGVQERGRWLFYGGEYKGVEPAIRLRTNLPAGGNRTVERHFKLRLRPLSSNETSLEKVEVRVQHYDNPAMIVYLDPDGDEVNEDWKPGPLSGINNVRLIEFHSDGGQLPLYEVYSESARTGQREAAKALIMELVPQVKDIEILTEAGKPILYLVYENGAVPVALSGDGIHALVRVALELASLPDGVALLEEPEVHQHPGAMWQTVRAIWAAVRRNVQVVLTTHSLEFIDMLLAEAKEGDIERLSLFRLELEKGRLIAVQTSGSDVAFCRGEIEQDLR